jgi:hypothetical protein
MSSTIVLSRPLSRLWRATAALALLLAPICGLPAFAATLTPDMPPEAVAAEAYARMQAGDWVGASGTFDPQALRGFREMFVPLLQETTGDAMAAGLFGTGTTAAEVAKMSDAEFFAGFIRRATGGLGVSLSGQQILGAVPEGEDRVHLVTRTRAETMGMRVTGMEVVTLNRTPQGWRLAMSGEMEGMAQMIRRMSEASAEEMPLLPPEVMQDP